MIQKQAKKFWFGWHNVGARPGKAWKVVTSNSSTQKYLQWEQKDAWPASLSFSKAIVWIRQRLQVILDLMFADVKTEGCGFAWKLKLLCWATNIGSVQSI